MHNPKTTTTQAWIASLALLLAGAAANAGEYPARLDWSRRVTLSTPVSGIVETVNVTAGERVEAGRLLIQLDERPLRTAVQSAEAQLHKQKLLHDEAKRELERTRELYERTVISVHDLQLQEIAYASAQADLESARARLSSAQLRLEYSRLHAPFAGLVLALEVQPGETVVNRQRAYPMAVLAGERPMIAQASLDAAALQGLAAGQSAGVVIGGRRVTGTITHIAGEPDENDNYLLEVSFEPGERPLRAGLPARIVIEP